MSRWLAFRRGMFEFPAVVLGNQVHGVEIMRIDGGTGWIQIEGIDGWITTTPGILLTVTIADCVPVYLVAPGRGVALLHAGWRGTAGEILGRGLERLRAAAGPR
ncbi:MAG TPA: polyphenol oxidase family protein, partial [Gemmatimonadales bacterium]